MGLTFIVTLSDELGEDKKLDISDFEKERRELAVKVLFH